jgi:hypothetical protein
MIFERNMVPAVNSRRQERDAAALPSGPVNESNEPLMIHKQRRMQLKMGPKDSDEFARKGLKDVD